MLILVRVSTLAILSDSSASSLLSIVYILLRIRFYQRFPRFVEQYLSPDVLPVAIPDLRLTTTSKQGYRYIAGTIERWVFIQLID